MLLRHVVPRQIYPSPRHPPRCFAHAEISGILRGKDPSKDALLRIGPGSPGSSANPRRRGNYCASWIMFAGVQLTLVRWYYNKADLNPCEARDTGDGAYQRSQSTGGCFSKFCTAGASFSHTISPIFTDERSLHCLRFRPNVLPLPPVEDDGFLPQA